MNSMIGCDANRRYSFLAILDTTTLSVEITRVNHHSTVTKDFLSKFPEEIPVVLETVSNYYQIVDVIEDAGCIPHLTHAANARVINGNIQMTDKIDAKDLATLVHLGKLPIVWLPPGEIRDERATILSPFRLHSPA